MWERDPKGPTMLPLICSCCPAVSTKSSDAKAVSVAQGSQWAVFFAKNAYFHVL